MKGEGLVAHHTFGWPTILEGQQGGAAYIAQWQAQLMRESNMLVRAMLGEHLNMFYDCARYISVTLPGSAAPLHLDSQILFAGVNKQARLAAFDLTLHATAIRQLQRTVMPQLPDREELGGYLLVATINGTAAPATLLLQTSKPAHIHLPLSADNWQILLNALK